MILKFSSLTAAAALLAAPAWAADAPAVHLDHVAARVIVIPEARANITAEVKGGTTSLPRPTLRTVGTTMIVSSDLSPARFHNCHVAGHRSGLSLGLFNKIRTEDLPVVTIRTPLDVNVEANGAIIGEIGPAHSVRLSQERCGRWTVADVADTFALDLQGTGDVDVGAVGKASVEMEGLGDVRLRSARGFSGHLQGMGDVRLDEVNGPVDVSLEGMGDLVIKGGHATSFKARLDGMGDIKFDGVAETVDASADGMGSIHVAKATGEVTKSQAGFSHVTVGR